MAPAIEKAPPRSTAPARSAPKSTPAAKTAPAAKPAPKAPAPAKPQDQVKLSPEAQQSAKKPGSDIDIPGVSNNPDKVKRNEQVTQSYHEISQGLDQVINPPGTPQSGPNWSSHATWASRQVGEGIQGKNLPPGAGHVSDVLSEGNTKVFQDVAPDMQSFIKEFGDDKKLDQDKFNDWSKRFGEDGAVKKDAFQSYYNARFETDADKKNEMVLHGNLKIAEHEQRTLDPVIDRAFESGGAQKGIIKGLVGAATGPVGTALSAFGLNPVENAAQSAAGAVNKKVGTDGLYGLVSESKMKFPDGQGGMREAGLGSDVPGSFPGGLQEINDPKLRDTMRGYGANPDAKDTKGSGSDDWSDYDQRMRYITDHFRVNGANREMITTNPQPGQAVDIPRAPEGPTNVGALTDSLRSNFSFLDTASQGGDRDGKISRDDLIAAAYNDKAPEGARSTAQELLRNADLMNGLDTASGGQTDGVISSGDLRRYT